MGKKIIIQKEGEVLEEYFIHSSPIDDDFERYIKERIKFHTHGGMIAEMEWMVECNTLVVTIKENEE